MPYKVSTLIYTVCISDLVISYEDPMYEVYQSQENIVAMQLLFNFLLLFLTMGYIFQFQFRQKSFILYALIDDFLVEV